MIDEKGMFLNFSLCYKKLGNLESSLFGVNHMKSFKS